VPKSSVSDTEGHHWLRLKGGGGLGRVLIAQKNLMYFSENGAAEERVNGNAHGQLPRDDFAAYASLIFAVSSSLGAMRVASTAPKLWCGFEGTQERFLTSGTIGALRARHYSVKLL